MVTKFVYVITTSANEPDDNTSTSTNTNENEKVLYEMLSHQKDVISDYYTNKKWDRYKKQGNIYELIFTTGHTFPSLSSYIPISRSFFKHWEILHDFADVLAFQKAVRATFLAEGPGGFIEAFTRYRSQASKGSDKLFGITLISSDRCVPNWKLSRNMQEQNNIRLLMGADGTGSLYSRKNIESYVAEIGEASCDYVTADGGFDFSNNFNNQEEISVRLIISEIYTAMRLLKPGGKFLLKIFDIYQPITKQIIAVLKANFETLYFIKPLTSRPANSEKYILCINASGAFEHRKALEEVVGMPQKMLNPHRLNGVQLISPTEFNMYYMARQIVSINMSLMSINCNQDHMETIRMQLEKGIKWLHKYKIPVQTDAIRYYKQMLKAMPDTST